MSNTSVNPFNGEPSQCFADISDAQVEEKLATAQLCYVTWRQTSYVSRAIVLNRAAVLMRERVEELAHTMTLEMGKHIDEAPGEVRFSADIVAYHAQHAAAFLSPQVLHPVIGDADMESSPIGVIFGIEPWNFPHYRLARVAGPHLMAGNVLVIKHAGCVPKCAIAFETLLLDARAPPGPYTNLLISHQQSDRVVDGPPIKGVAPTGSVAARRSVAARAGQNLKPSSMELGGSDAFIVLEDADLDLAVRWAIWGRMYGGQTCCAAKRFNNISWSDAELPFGGIEDSGYARELGSMGIQAFVNKKTGALCQRTSAALRGTYEH